jgi:hypothetical protein
MSWTDVGREGAIGFGGAFKGISGVPGTGKLQPALLDLLRVLSVLSALVEDSIRSPQLPFPSSGPGESLYGAGFGDSNEGHAVIGVGELVFFSTSCAGLVDTDIPAKGLRSLNDGDFGALGYGEGVGLNARLSILKADPLSVLDDARDRDETCGGSGEMEVSKSPNSSSFPGASAMASNNTSLAGCVLWG